ncbi:AAA family ATPase [Flavobacterium sp. I3-2]|uniref:AAA family ATPase n=1 Tax=Flavobacterium sp. I3-2 TaxID=2748319 RepID=UPI0015AF0AA8|nr:ATP-binding protein [Flavobacterium sp. I3-2]
MSNRLIKSVKLNGYKSIKDIDIKLEGGLNLIIGKNSVGKSNFLDFFHKILTINLDDIANFDSEILFSDDSRFEIEKSFTLEKNESKSFTTSSKIEINFNDKFFDRSITFKEFITDSDNLPFQVIKVCHGLPSNKLFISDDVYFKHSKSDFDEDFFKIMRDPSVTSFTKNLLLFVYREMTYITNLEDKNFKSYLANKIEDVLYDLNLNIKNLTSIEEIRVNKGFDIYTDANSISIKNLKLEYKVDGVWLDFDHLSDGTKRVFYIVSEVLSSLDTTTIIFTPYGFQEALSVFNRTIVLIEEPEIGLHPKQFNSLLQFLKDESETKQILFTTHSPLSLNIVGYKDLDKIIIFRKDNNKTIAANLSDQEKMKINQFKQDSGLYLSDYWLFTNTDF